MSGDFREPFRAVWRNVWVYIIVSVVVCCVGLALIPVLQRGAMFIIIPYVVIAWIWHLSVWRCPACRCWLGKGLFINHCPRCGALLRD